MAIDYNPPSWLVVEFPRIKLDEERAKKFHDLRKRMCAYLGKDVDDCEYNALFMKALDLLFANESALLAKVEHINFNEEGQK